MNRAVAAATWLRDQSRRLEPGEPVKITYHPLVYAWDAHRAYLERYGEGRKKALLVGMNPGPWGMGQNGIPFGEKAFVGEWLGLQDTQIGRPPVEHPKRPVTGWACPRSEASGKRVWGFLKDLYGSPERALRDLLIVNHCPLLMYTEAGTNVTPDKLKRPDQEQVFAVCDEGLRRMIEVFRPEVLIGVGKYAASRCEIVAEGGLRVNQILHPSPASPLANRENGAYWRRSTREVFEAEGLLD